MSAPRPEAIHDLTVWIGAHLALRTHDGEHAKAAILAQHAASLEALKNHIIDDNAAELRAWIGANLDVAKADQVGKRRITALQEHVDTVNHLINEARRPRVES